MLSFSLRRGEEKTERGQELTGIFGRNKKKIKKWMVAEKKAGVGTAG